MRVVIVGAGIGGLVTALRLHRAGIACVVIEQSLRLREVGVGINLLPHAVRVLAELDLLDSLDATGVRTRELVYLHRLGPEILHRPCGIDAGHDLPQLSIHRGRLQGVLLQAVSERIGAAAVCAGRRLVAFDQDGQGVRARVVDRRTGRRETFAGDVLVGADGIHSTVRSLLFPTEGAPRWNGVLMWRGATEWHRFATGRSMLVAGGTAAKLVVYPIGAGTQATRALTNWAVCLRTGKPGDPLPARQDWSRPADRARVEGELGRFRLPMLDHVGLVRATDACFEFPMCDRDPLPFWSRGGVTLLGDAAHPMYPMGSNGAGQAVLDAASLATALARRGDPVRALHEYEGARRLVTSDIVLRNRIGGPEGVIDEVERRAPAGFADVSDVIDPAELAAMVDGYTRASSASTDRAGSALRSLVVSTSRLGLRRRGGRGR
jgi:5-methylphenazine-1-carboxylate 1-monooxygenase